jgi:hypothetical protein
MLVQMHNQLIQALNIWFTENERKTRKIIKLTWELCYVENPLIAAGEVKKTSPIDHHILYQCCRLVPWVKTT